MKTTIDIIAGSHESEKKDLLDRFLDSEVFESCVAQPITSADMASVRPSAVYVITDIDKIATEDDLHDFFIRLSKNFSPDCVFILDSDTHSCSELVSFFGSRGLKSRFTIDKTAFAAGCGSISGDLAAGDGQLGVCDAAFLPDVDCEALSSAIEIIKAGNPAAEILQSGSDGDIVHFLSERREKSGKSLFNSALIFTIAAVVVYLVYQVLRAVNHSNITSHIQNIVTIFLSVLYEAFPFILIGIFVSSIIQVLIPAAWLEKVFTKNKPAAFLAALFAGVLFPVCDCATVPVAASLVKKGVPAPVAVTFLLAAPIVNPIVIASTLFAFPGYPFIAVCRIVSGLLIALLSGVAVRFLTVRDGADPVIRADAESRGCEVIPSGKGVFGKISGIFQHAAEEFFEVGIYLIVGALISSIFQACLPKSAVAGLGGSFLLSLLLMMLSAFVLSICSTSDAFIARTFANSLPIGSVMGFIVLGPMLDIKNLLLLSANFKKRFVLKVVAVVVVISFAVLMTASRFLVGLWVK